MKRSRKNQPNSGANCIFKAAFEAAKELGSDGKGRDGVAGYFRSFAKSHPVQFVALLAKVMDIEGPPEEVAPKILRTEKEVEAEMKARGLPVPKEMFS